MKSFVDYFEFVVNSMWTIATGMMITLRHFFYAWFIKDATMLYPEEKPVVSERYRGIHILDIETCIACLQCAKACPIDCIVIRVDRNKENKEVAFHEFSLDYNKCMFCHLCIEPCPVECIDMGKTIEFNVFNREDLVLDLRRGMNQYDSQGEGGLDKGRESNFMPGFNNTVFNILRPHEYFEDKKDENPWSRTDGRRMHNHEKSTARLTGLEKKSEG